MNHVPHEPTYRLDTTARVWCRPDFASISYSDGDLVEQRIAAVIQQAQDLSVLSPELSRHCADWPSLYHLSASRANILRPFRKILKNADVLEIGAGCGAITRYLGEVGANVLALEGSMRRAVIARSRCRDLENVSVLAEKFEQYEGLFRFDVVTLIGVLEYAAVFSSEANPPLALLRQVRSLLKPDGLLIIAIENKLGLKYFAGAPEDHAGKPMYGIEGRYKGAEPRTYGKAELDRLLIEAGFAKAEFMAPFPDYKLPVSIITEAGFACGKFDASALASQAIRLDPQLPGVLAFSPERVWPALVENGMGIGLANSFLIKAAASTCRPEEHHVLAWHYSTRRLPKYCKETIFSMTEMSGDVAIHQMSIAPSPDKETKNGLLHWHITDTAAYYRGKPLSAILCDVVIQDGWHISDLTVKYLEYLSFLKSTAASRGHVFTSTSLDSQIPGYLWDALPQNIIVDRAGEWHIFDQEWELAGTIPLGWLLFRSMQALFQASTRIGLCKDIEWNTRAEFIETLLFSLGMTPTRQLIDYYADLEDSIQKQIFITDQPCCSYLDSSLPLMNCHLLIDHQNRKLDELQHAVNCLNSQNDAMQTSLNCLNSQNDAMQTSLNCLHSQNDAMRTSLCWRISKPLRFLGDIVIGACRTVDHTDNASLPPIFFSVTNRIKSCLNSVPLFGRISNVKVQLRHFCMRYVVAASKMALRLDFVRNVAFKFPFIRKCMPDLCSPSGWRNCSYENFIRIETQLQEENCRIYADEVANFTHTPLLSVVVPVFNTRLDLLEKCLKSVERQIYTNWELCIVDDCSTLPEIRPFLLSYCEMNVRTRLLPRANNGHIAKATNDGIAMARGEYVVFLDHDDELSVDALYQVVKRICAHPDADIIYTDQDKITDKGQRYEPFFKPDWSPTYFRGVMYLGHLLVARTALIRAVGGCDSTFDGVQDFELALRMTEKARRVEHVPRVCYHWRATAGSVAAKSNAKPNLPILQQRAVQAQLDRLGLKAQAVQINADHRIRVVPVAPPFTGMVSIIICSKDAGELVSRCLDSIYSKTRYSHFEVIVGDNGTTDSLAISAFGRHPIRRINMPGEFHFARFNNQLAREAHGDYLLFLNNDTEILDANWLEYMLFHACQPDVGAVGPLLIYDDHTVQHAGVILGPRGTADHLMRHFPAESDGYNGSLVCDREVTAVTAACLLVSAEKFRAACGFNELFRHHYEDLDFCLRLRKAGYGNIYVGSTRLVHHESKSRGKYYDYTDRVLLLDLWEDVIRKGDPFYSIHFNPSHIDYTICSEGILT